MATAMAVAMLRSILGSILGSIPISILVGFWVSFWFPEAGLAWAKAKPRRTVIEVIDLTAQDRLG